MLLENDRRKGLLLNLTGDGKGKTSSALGMALRALGWEWNIAVIQFVKNDMETGEKRFFRRWFPDTIFEQHGGGLRATPEEHAVKAAAGWRRAAELLREFPGELLILDELNNALDHRLLDTGEVVAALLRRRPALNVVVTGRRSPDRLRDASDLISEIADIRHPFGKGIPARPGLDF